MSQTAKIERTLSSYQDFREAEKADQEFYKGLSGNEKLNIALAIMAPYYATYSRFERIYRIAELGKSPIRDHWGMGS
jgi:hypothetical protein